MSPSTLTEVMRRVSEQEKHLGRQGPTARQWLEAKARAPKYASGCRACYGTGRDMGDWSLACPDCQPRDRNGFVTRSLEVFRVLLETDVRIVRPDRLHDYYMEGLVCENWETTVLASNALWTISLASNVETRELEVIATSWGNLKYPNPAKRYVSSPAVVLIRDHYDRSIIEWLDEFTY